VNHIEINLNDPFEKTLAAVRTLPHGRDRPSAQDEIVALALRYLYTVAHGRTLQTSIGPISVMPSVDPSLKEASFSLCTRTDLLVLAEQRTVFRRSATQNGHWTQVGAGSAFELMASRLAAPERWPLASNGQCAGHRQQSVSRGSNPID
jgi:hypothetical protein